MSTKMIRSCSCHYCGAQNCSINIHNVSNVLTDKLLQRVNVTQSVKQSMIRAASDDFISNLSFSSDWSLLPCNRFKSSLRWVFRRVLTEVCRQVIRCLSQLAKCFVAVSITVEQPALNFLLRCRLWTLGSAAAIYQYHEGLQPPDR